MGISQARAERRRFSATAFLNVCLTLWQSEWVETDWSKSDNKALATKGQKFTSLTTINIHFLRPHEPRRAEHAYQGARRAPWTRPARQNIGKGPCCKGLRARRTLLAAAEAPSRYRHMGDISNMRDPRAVARP